MNGCRDKGSLGENLGKVLHFISSVDDIYLTIFISDRIDRFFSFHIIFQIKHFKSDTNTEHVNFEVFSTRL